MFKTRLRMDSVAFIFIQIIRKNVLLLLNSNLCLYKSDTQNVGDHDGDMSETKFTEHQQEILNLIKESPTVTGKRFPIRVSKMRRNTAMET